MYTWEGAKITSAKVHSSDLTFVALWYCHSVAGGGSENLPSVCIHSKVTAAA